MGLVFLIDRPGYRLATDRKVLKRNEAAVIEQITRAYVHAQGEINTALGNLDAMCSKASEDAYRKGLAKAEREAAERWTLVEVERLKLLQAMQPALADIIVDAVSLLANDIEREKFLAHALQLLQSALRVATWARLRVHPEAVAAAETAVAEFDRHTGLGKLARVVADESLSAQSCVLESDAGRVDASLSTQLEAIRGAISSVVTGTTAEPSS
jgi:type III secretion protein L